jgi:trigger factor
LSYARETNRTLVTSDALAGEHSVGRGRGIRTPDLLLPKQVRYRCAIPRSPGDVTSAPGGCPGVEALTWAATPVDSGLRMKTVVEPLEGNKVKMSIEVDEQEFERSIDAAFRKIAREVRIPGFRPGKAPRRILEARLGAAAGRAEALRESVPDYYAEALRENEVDAIAPPEIDITAGEESGAVAFDAVVEVRPQIALEGYGHLTVTVPSPEVSEEDISAQIDRMRANFGTLEAVDRPAVAGDNLTIDLKATRDGETVAGLTTTDFLYELGSASVLPELDDKLPGAKVGDILAFDASFGGPGDDDLVQLEVLVKDIQAKVLPEITDEWVSDASEFDTVDELRADIVKRLGMVKRMQASLGLRNGAVEALVELVTVDAPEPLVNAEIERRAHDLGHRLEQQGATIAQYLEATGQSEEQVVAELRSGAEPAVKADLALRAIAEAEALDPTAAEIDAEIERLATAENMDAATLRQTIERAGQMLAVRSDLRRSKALEWLVDHVDLVDPDGRPVDRALLTPEAILAEAAIGDETDAESDVESGAEGATSDPDAGTDTGSSQPQDLSESGEA